MCGFVGLIRPEKISDTLLIAARDEMVHRGPDDEGLYLSKDKCLGLGFRRLSIIDLSPQGHQPMTNEDKTLWIVFNGEVYNYIELRKELECLGHHFSSNTDTETILHGYEAWGTEVVKRLRGMFAFAIWDENKRRLFLSVDPVGIKPLYYYKKNGTFAFASELKSLLTFHFVSRELDFSALNQYLAFGYIPSEESIFREIKKLTPGHYFLYWDGGQFEKRRYFESADLNSDQPAHEEGLVERLHDLLADSVQRALRSDVPVGVFLSGGIDSSIVASLAASHSSNRIKTFSIGFEEDRYNELPYARMIASFISSDHHEFTVTMNSLDALDRISRQYDEPFGDSSAVPTYYVSKMAKEHVKVALSGDGGDELFGGYNWYTWVKKVQRIKRLLGPLASPISHFSDILPARTPGKNFLCALQNDAANQLIDRTFIFKRACRKKIIKRELHEGIQLSLPEDRVRQAFYAGNRDLVTAMQSVDLCCYLPFDGLVKVDRASMMSSVEVRPPFLDKEIIKFALSLPEEYKIRGSVKKYLLKKLAMRLLPSDFRLERKQGFCVPLREWFRSSLSDLLADAMSDQCVRVYLDISYLKKLISTHKKGQLDNSAKLWSALVFSLWARNYL